jgi:hypothetical protein
MLWHGVVLRSSPVAARRAPPRQARPHIQAKSTVKKKAFRPSLSPSSPSPNPIPSLPSRTERSRSHPPVADQIRTTPLRDPVANRGALLCHTCTHTRRSKNEAHGEQPRHRERHTITQQAGRRRAYRPVSTGDTDSGVAAVI